MLQINRTEINKESIKKFSTLYGDISKFSFLLNDPKCFSLSAYKEGYIIGNVFIFNTGDFYMAEAIYVKTEYRRKGIALQLAKRLREECKNSDIQKLYVLIRDNNAESLRLVGKLGFKKDQEMNKKESFTDRTWLSTVL